MNPKTLNQMEDAWLARMEIVMGPGWLEREIPCDPPPKIEAPPAPLAYGTGTADEAWDRLRYARAFGTDEELEEAERNFGIVR